MSWRRPVIQASELIPLEVATLRRICTLPERLSVTDWAAKYRVLPETSTAPGPFDPSVVPYARRPTDLLADPDVSMVVLCWASQTTKSTVLENGIAYRIAQMPTPMVIVRPKIDDAEGWAKERFAPMVRATPALAARINLSRGGDSTMRYKRFPGGFIFVASAQSATELASRSAPFMLFDEVDRMEPIPGEGDPVQIGLKRQGATDVASAALTSTPGEKDTSIVWPLLEAGTNERFHVECPHCAGRQELVWGGRTEARGLKWDAQDFSTAAYLCAFCGALIEEQHKAAMLAGGVWVPTNSAGAYPSFHLSALYSPFAKSSWAALAEEFVKADGKPKDLQVFVNTRLAECWEEKGEQVSATELAGRLELHEQGMVPAGVAYLTAGVDVQSNRIEVYVWGWGVGFESWLIAAEVLPGDPAVEPGTPGGVWNDLDAVLTRSFRHTSGRSVSITAAFLDSGYSTQQVYRFAKTRQRRRVHAAKGVGGAGLPIVGKPSLQTQARYVLFPLGVDTIKDEFLRSQIYTTKHGPGFVHLPTWLSADLCEQLVSEKRVSRLVKGRKEYYWVKKREDQPNEALDCRNYARAAYELLGAARHRAAGAIAAALSEAQPAAVTPAPTEPSDPPALPPPKASPRYRTPSSWATRW